MLSHGLRVEDEPRARPDNHVFPVFRLHVASKYRTNRFHPSTHPGASALTRTSIVSLSTVLEKYYDCPTHKIASYPID